MLDNTNVRALTNESHALISNKICRQSPFCAVLHSLAVENNLERGLSRERDRFNHERNEIMLSQLEGSLNFGGNKSMETVVIKCHSKPPARATLMLT